LFVDANRLPRIQSDLKTGTSILKKIMTETPVSALHTKKGGIHIIGLFRREGKIYVIEDTGRHNAFDKAIGYGPNHNWVFPRQY
jgi:formate dehydrogenase accessory protein FdhD